MPSSARWQWRSAAACHVRRSRASSKETARRPRCSACTSRARTSTSTIGRYKGALKDRARTIYSGTVIIRQGAHKCDAYQTNRNILLSEQARADSIPNLEILSNDPVRCGHAASVGPVDDDVIFYMQSRGIPYEEAERLVVIGFFQEVLDRVTLLEVRSGLESAIAAEIEKVHED
ncbi:MAG: SufD family Fe-S cluster assembly protein [Actinobacteria bacterium]|nr:MAG: SufD family Fe-S cluster assembly protein [Actinomycetota bacterium]